MSAAYLRRGDGSVASDSLFESLGLQSMAPVRSHSKLSPSPKQSLPGRSHYKPTMPIDEEPASSSVFASLGLEKGSVPSVHLRSKTRRARRAARCESAPMYVSPLGLHINVDMSKRNGIQSIGSTLTNMPSVPELSESGSDDGHGSGYSTP